MANNQLNLPWYEKAAISFGLSQAEKRNPTVKKIIDELSTPALWATLATAVPLIAQLFTGLGNPHLAALGGILVAAYSVAVQLKDAFLHVPPPATPPSTVAPAHPNDVASVSVTHAQTAAAATAIAGSAERIHALVQKVESTISAAEQAIEDKGKGVL